MVNTALVYSRKDAAERVGLSLRSFQRALAEGELPIVQLGARRIGVAHEDLVKWVEAKREPAQVGASKRRPKSSAQEATAT